MTGRLLSSLFPSPEEDTVTPEVRPTSSPALDGPVVTLLALKHATDDRPRGFPHRPVLKRLAAYLETSLCNAGYDINGYEWTVEEVWPDRRQPTSDQYIVDLEDGLCSTNGVDTPLQRCSTTTFGGEKRRYYSPTEQIDEYIDAYFDASAYSRRDVSSEVETRVQALPTETTSNLAEELHSYFAAQLPEYR